MAEAARTLHFNDCELDLAARELRVHGQIRAIEPKAFDLLAYLVEHRDRVVEKDELQDALWPDVVVTEASLTRTIMKARKAVDDDAHTQGVIKTLPRHGYRFVATIQAAHPEPLALEPDGLSPVQFVKSGDVHIAYRSYREGSLDILLVPGFVSHLDLHFRIRPIVRMYDRFTPDARLIIFDKRGIGLSDRIGYPPTLEHTVDDMLAVLDAMACERAVLIGTLDSGPATALFAASYPHRTRALIMYDVFAKGLKSDDYPWARSREDYDAWLDRLIAEWGGPASLEVFAPSLADDAEGRDVWARYLRASATPGSIRDILEVVREIDVRDVLPSIQAPTLILHRKGNRLVQQEAGADMAARIPGARFELLEGDDHWWFLGDTKSVLRPIQGFLAELAPAADTETVLATLLALEVTGGDAAFEQSVRETIDHLRGRVIDATRGFLVASVDGPSRALHCARIIRDRAAVNQVAIRAGLHAGEVSFGDGHVAGPAVDIARALMEGANSGDVLTTSTLRDLVAGSGLQFDRRKVPDVEPACCRLC